MVEGILTLQLGFWNMMFGLISNFLGMDPVEFGKDGVWSVISGINGSLQAIGLALIPIFFMFGMIKASATYIEMKRPEAIGKAIVRFCISWAVIVFGMQLLMWIWTVCQGLINRILVTSGFQNTDLTIPAELKNQLDHAGFFNSILFMDFSCHRHTDYHGTVHHGCTFCIRVVFFRIYLYIALAPTPLQPLPEKPTQKTGISFIRGFASVCLEGAIIVLACIIFSLFATTSVFPMDSSNVWAALLSYLGGVIFNMLILVGIVKMADRVTREMLGL